MAEDEKPAPPPRSVTEPPMQAQQVPTDTTGLTAAYTNWYRVLGTPEELIIDFGINPQLGQASTEPVKLSQRMIMSFYTAKRLLNHLQYAVSRHEGFFGPLELDFQRRLRSVPAAPIPRQRKKQAE
jgi:hypothetical protein